MKDKEQLEAESLAGQNELDATVRGAELRLAALADAGGKNWRLWLGPTLIALGAAFGRAGNITSAV